MTSHDFSSYSLIMLMVKQFSQSVGLRIVYFKFCLHIVILLVPGKEFQKYQMFYCSIFLYNFCVFIWIYCFSFYSDFAVVLLVYSSSTVMFVSFFCFFEVSLYFLIIEKGLWYLITVKLTCIVKQLPFCTDLIRVRI